MTVLAHAPHFDFGPYAKVTLEGMYLPHLMDAEFLRLHAMVPKHSPVGECSYYTLYTAVRQTLHVPGIFMECGVFRGGSASFIANVIDGSGKEFHLFDTFAGMPDTNPMRDPVHLKGDFADTSLAEVRETVGHTDFVHYHAGFIPYTFADIVDRSIALAHVDVDIHQSVKDCCEFIYPRLASGGMMLFDDYGHCTCIGARQAVDEFFADKRERPITLYSGQALVVKL